MAGRERLLTGYRGRLLLLVSVGTTVVMTTRLALAPVLPRVIEDLGISPGLAGIALSVTWAMVAAEGRALALVGVLVLAVGLTAN